VDSGPAGLPDDCGTACKNGDVKVGRSKLKTIATRCEEYVREDGYRRSALDNSLKELELVK
jgi:hypothetical protein